MLLFLLEKNMYSQPTVLGNSHAFRKQKALMEIKHKRTRMLTLIGYLLMPIFICTTSNHIYNLSNYYLNITSLLKYELISRDGECNIFVNGLNEEMKVCPEGIEKESSL